MAREIERKYLVKGDEWRKMRPVAVRTMTQGYVPEDAEIYIAAREEGISIRICTGAQDVMIMIDDCPENKGFRDVFHLTGYDAQSTRLTLGRELVMRVRSATENQKTSATVTIKEATDDPEVRTECEAVLPAEKAEYLLETVCVDYVSKTRHVVECSGQEWDVDVFHGPLDGLIMAEVEVATEDEFNNLCLLPGVDENITSMAGIDNRALGRDGVPDALAAKIS